MIFLHQIDPVAVSLGPLRVHWYGLMYLLGFAVAWWLGRRRVRVGRLPGVDDNGFGDLMFYGMLGVVLGGRLGFVLFVRPGYFLDHPLAALKIWQGGLGIWGGVAGGALGAWYACRRYGLLLPPFGDALAPGLAVAQAIGRWGNWFNQELFGRPTELPWGLQIDLANRPAGFEQYATFHPTFLYESLWCLFVAVVVWWLDRRFRMGHGRVFATYVALYCLGRLFWELLRIDDATLILGVRVNVFTSIVVGLGAVVYIVVSRRYAPGREDTVYRPGRQPQEPTPVG